MRLKVSTRTACALTLFCVGLHGQTVSSSLLGVVVDSSDAPVVSAPVTLTSVDTRAIRTASTDNTGTYRFEQVDPGTYNLTVKQSGYKTETQINIVISAQDAHSGGKMVMQSGSVAESIAVAAETGQLQMLSPEEFRTLDIQKLQELDLTVRGRDVFSYLDLVPGIVDAGSQLRDTPSSTALGGITLNGNPPGMINVTVDGITDMDAGTNTSLHYEPNLDSIHEMKVLGAAYQAEYGRNSGGVITIVTKNGAQQFHGTGQWTHRNDEFDANSWSNNNTIVDLTGQNQAMPRAQYRFNSETYGIGGPVYIPDTFNKDKKQLFFYFSQERTGQLAPQGNPVVYTPTADERTGVFSDEFGNNGAGGAVALKILDPANNNIPFPNNTIPSSRISSVGEEMLNFFPLPNYTPVNPTQLYLDNYTEQASSSHPRRNEVLRFDAPVTDKLSGYFRWINNVDHVNLPYSGVDFTSNDGSVFQGAGLTGIEAIDHTNPGHSFGGTLIYTMTPTMVNEVTIGEDWNSSAYYPTNSYDSETLGLIPGTPSLFPIPTGSQNGPQSGTNGYQSILPTFSFGGTSGFPTTGVTGSSGTMTYQRAPGPLSGTYEDFNTAHSFQDNFSRTLGHHAFKFGAYFEVNDKVQPESNNYAGSFSFMPSTSDPVLNTGSGFVLALLGQTSLYTQSTSTETIDSRYWDLEFYAQDQWKVSRRLTIDLGARFYHQTPPHDRNGNFVNFMAANYSASTAPRLYYPACTGAAKTCTPLTGEVALDKLTDATASSAYIGDVVPGSGNYVDGSSVLGSAGGSKYPYTLAPVAVAPRIGFAYDLFGNGTTAIRGGFGVYYNNDAGTDVYGLAGQAPLAYTESVSDQSFAQIAAFNTGAAPVLNVNNLPLAPNSPAQSYAFGGNVPRDGVRNASLDIQRKIGGNTVVDIGYVFDHSFNQPLSYDLNYLPLGAGWPFTASNLAPNTSGGTSADIGADFERKVFPGLGDVTTYCWCGATTYNALNLVAARRLSHGLTLGLNYTYSKDMGVLTDTAPANGLNGAPTNNQWNYGRTPFDRTHTGAFTYTYDLPSPSKALGVKKLAILTDHWTLAGIATVRSGAPYSPTCSLVSGAPTVTGGYTGTPDLTARCNVVGNPYSNISSNGNGQVYFNPNAFAMSTINTNGPNNSVVGGPAIGDLGGGAGVLSLPRVTNVDMTLTKNLRLGEKAVIKLQVQAYNVFNHTEISGINSNINFNSTSNQVTNTSALGYIDAATNARILAFTARLQF